MKIISPFKDFYDYAICPCNEEEIIWHRTENLSVIEQGKIEKKKYSDGTFFSYSTDTRYVVPKEIQKKINHVNKIIKNMIDEYEKILIVGDKIFAIMNVETITKDNFLFLWNGEMYEIYKCDIKEKIIKKHEFYNETKTVYDCNLIDYSENFDKNTLKKWWKEQGFKFKKLIELLYEEDIQWLTDKYKNERLNNIKKEIRKEFPSVPLISIDKHGILLNPKLKDTIWSKLIPATIIYQEIELFLNKYYLKERTIDISNEDKIIANGFDIKNSFRKK